MWRAKKQAFTGHRAALGGHIVVDLWKNWPQSIIIWAKFAPNLFNKESENGKQALDPTTCWAGYASTRARSRKSGY